MADTDNSEVDAVEESAGPLGVWIREARESKNLTAASVAEALRLDKHIVEKLEAEDFADLGALVFVKGHLRAIVNLLGLDVDEAMQRFHASAGQVSDEAPALIVNYNSSVSRRPSSTTVLFGAGIVVIALLALAVWMLWPSAKSATSPESSPAIVESTQPSNSLSDSPQSNLPREEATVSPPSTASLAQTPAATASVVLAPAQSPRSASDQSGLRLVFSGTCWFEVRDANDRRVAYGTATASTERVVTGERPFRVTLGVANVVSVYVDGEPYTISPEERRGRAARLTIN